MDRVSGSGSGSKGELSRSEVVLLLLLSEGSKRKLVLCQSPSESSGLLVSQVIGSSLLLGVSASLVSSLLVDHSKHLSNGLSYELLNMDDFENSTYSDAGELDLGGGGNLANSQLSEFFLKNVGLDMEEQLL